MTLVFCAPGYPGGTADAQPYVDQFAQAAAAAAGWPAGSLTATYQPTEQGCIEKLAGADAALVFTPYPFFVEHGARLRLTPYAQADVAGAGLEQRWTLVTKAGLGPVPASLAGYTILSTAGYAPEFVRHFGAGRAEAAARHQDRVDRAGAQCVAPSSGRRAGRRAARS